MEKTIESTSRSIWFSRAITGTAAGKLLSEESFNRVIYRERKRAERSGASLLLLVFDISRLADEAGKRKVLTLLSGPIQSGLRETDACGWIRTGEQVGIIFVEITAAAVGLARRAVVLKVRTCLAENLRPTIYQKVGLTLHIFPGEHGDNEKCDLFNRVFYPELLGRDVYTRFYEVMNRTMDLVGSMVALVLFSPIFLFLPIAIKLTSPGPVLFRQTRIGQFGKPFTFLKFRTMHCNNNDAIHREYMKSFIANNLPGCATHGNGEVIYKIQHDPRVTRIGSFLRKTSLDELPQFINVLRGEMSLVGPRPPIPYEVDDYASWHHYRILARRPGITGLWQVKGRSLTAFDGMVRLDLRYIRTWSLWLDVKLLLATPIAMLRGKGAC